MDTLNKSDIKDDHQIENEIQALKEKIKEIEDKLRELRNRQTFTPSPSKSGDDNSQMFNHLIERIEKLENSHEKMNDRVDDQGERIEKLEQDNHHTKEKIDNINNDISAIKDQLPDKVDCDVFDHEISYIKELLNQLMQGKEIDTKALPPPPASSGVSTKEMNKIKEMMARIPEIEKAIQDILERLRRAEHNIDNHSKSIKDHDKQIEDIWEELNKKANQSDLKDLFDRLNTLEKDIAKIIEHINNLGKGKPATVASPLPNTNDKRLDALEKKVDELKYDMNNGLRDLSKLIDALNSRVSGNEKEIQKLKDELLKLLKRVNDIELKIDTLIKTSGGPAQTVQVSSIDPEKLDELRKALNELRNDHSKFKNEVYDKFNQVDQELDRKADKEDLERLKRMLLEKLDELEKALNKTKADLKRALKILNDKVTYYFIYVYKIDC